MAASLLVLESTDRVVFDLEANARLSAGMLVSVARFESEVSPFTQTADSVIVHLPRTLAAGDVTLVELEWSGSVYHEGDPGFGYRVTNYTTPTHEEDTARKVAQTLSEPISARKWWPCHDHPADAFTIELTVEVPEGWEVAAPGHRVGDRMLHNGRHEYTNALDHAIPSYLVSFVAADLERWTETITVDELRPDGSILPRAMDLVYFAPTNWKSTVEQAWASTGDILDFFSSIWGPYPYADVKYGNVLCRGTFGMEHPTMSSIGDSPSSSSPEPRDGFPYSPGEMTNVHEIAHQWFGDALRLERWGEVWLNEGFATYAERLWIEERYGEDYATDIWVASREFAQHWTEPLVDPQPRFLFGNVSYVKGAWVLRMLNSILGRDGLLAAMRSYATDPDLRYSTVTTARFQGHCEAVFGQPLDWFFDAWTGTRTGVDLEIDAASNGTRASLRIRQDPADFVRMPLTIRLVHAGGGFEDHSVWLDIPDQTVELVGTEPLASVLIDPDAHWLVRPRMTSFSRFRLSGVGPNPLAAGAQELRVDYSVGLSTAVHLEIFDVRGRLVRASQPVVRSPGFYSETWDGEDESGRPVASGIYFARLVGGGVTEVRKVTVLR